MKQYTKCLLLASLAIMTTLALQAQQGGRRPLGQPIDLKPTKQPAAVPQAVANNKMRNYAQQNRALAAAARKVAEENAVAANNSVTPAKQAPVKTDSEMKPKLNRNDQ
ncbi:MAG: hypothetical protein QM664_05445 [Flavihumibacter sp.]